MTTYTIADIFVVVGQGPTNGAAITAWRASRFNIVPVQGAAPPSGSQDAGPVTTGIAFGGPGAFQVACPTNEDYYILAQYNGTNFWSRRTAVIFDDLDGKTTRLFGLDMTGHAVVNAAPGLASTDLATVGQVNASGVATFNGRAGVVTLLKADVTGTGLTYTDVGADASGAAATVQTNLTAEAATRAAADTTNATAITTETTRATAAEALLAPLASPALTGSPTVPNQSALTNNTRAANTAYADAAVAVEVSRATTAEALKAPLASPTFTGVPAAPTAAANTNTTQVATTAFVTTAVGAGGVVSSVFTRTGAVVATSGDYSVGQVTGAAPLASPALTGTPTAPTAAAATNTTQLATTAFVEGEITTAQALDLKIASNLSDLNNAGTARTNLGLGTIATLSSTPTADLTTAWPASTVAKIQGTTVGAPTGTAGSAVVLATGPTLSNPVVGTQATTDNSTKAASTAYVTTAVANAVAGVNPAVAVQAATTAAANTSGFTYANGVGGIGATLTNTSNANYTVDGYTFTAVGQRLLVKNDTQSPSGAFNGIYSVTTLNVVGVSPIILTRVLDYDQPSDINNTGAIPVVNGTVNALTSWICTSTVTTVGTDALTFSQFSFSPSLAVGGDLTGTLPNPTIAKVQGVVTGAPTGTGSVVFSTSPTLVTPALGTPASGVLTNATGTAAGLTAGAVTLPAALGSSTATTQAILDASTKIATTAYADATLINLPEMNGYKAWTFDPILSAVAVIPTKGFIYYTQVYIAQAFTIANIDWYVTTAGNVNSASYVAIYNTAGTRLAVSADIQASFGTKANQICTTAISYVVATPGYYWVALLIGTGATTSPTLFFANASATAFENANLANGSGTLVTRGATSAAGGKAVTDSPVSGTSTAGTPIWVGLR